MTMFGLYCQQSNDIQGGKCRISKLAESFETDKAIGSSPWILIIPSLASEYPLFNKIGNPSV